MSTSEYDSLRPPEPMGGRRGGNRPRTGRRGGGDGSREMPMVPEAEFGSYYGRPVVKPAPWGHEVGAYLFLGGVAGGSGLLAAGAQLTGRAKLRRNARLSALAAVALGAVALVMDLGRPERFLNMMRIFKPRSPMNTGAWCLVGFSTSSALAVGCDLIARPNGARLLGALTALFGTYLGSYTGVLLACTAVPVWSRSRTILGPAFVATATATGTAATRLVLVATGLPHGHPTRRALGTIETASMLTELVLSAVGERRLGDAGEALERGRPGAMFRTAKGLVWLGLSLRLAARRVGSREHDLASAMYLAAGLLFRFAWVYAGKASATDDASVAAMGRGRRSLADDQDESPPRRALSVWRSPLPLPDAARRAYGEAVRRTSLAVERWLRR